MAYDGKIPSGVRTVREGALTRVYFNWGLESRKTESADGEETEEQVLSCEVVDVRDADYGAVVSAIVRDRYSASDVEAVLANYQEAIDGSSDLADTKRTEYKNDYAAFQAWRAKAKEVAKDAVGAR